ncbi:MAG: shikimate kinase [Myxococcota bacterium]
MDDYYAPHPRLLLGEPLVLAGHVGAGTAATARAMAARTGLPFCEVDRMAENAAGRSLGQVLSGEGLAALARYGSQALDRALDRRPCAVIALGHTALSDEGRVRLRDEARLVYLRRPTSVLLTRIQERLRVSPGSLFQFSLGTPTSVEELVPFFEPREEVLREADTVVEAGDRHPHEIASQLLDALDRISAVDRL